MSEKLNPKALANAVSVLAIALVVGALIVIVVIAPSVVVHDHRAEQSLIEKYWPAPKQ